MVKEVRWTTEAVETFNKVIEYLQDDWTEKEIESFIKTTDRIILYIAEHPQMFRRTNKKNIHEAIITPHNLLVYKVYPSHIDLITFWDTRRNPRKKKH